MLQRLGIDMVEAGSGSEGMDKLNESPDIQAILLDLKLPDGDGGEWAKTLADTRPELPIVFFTGGTVPNSSSATDRIYLGKPFTKGTLRDVLQRAAPDMLT